MRESIHQIRVESRGNIMLGSGGTGSADPWSGVANVVILPTEACNLRCVYCYQGHTPRRMTSEVQKGVQRLLERLVGERELERLHLDWYGGEPLAAWHVIESIATRAVELAESTGTRLTMSMTTNGTLLTQERFRKLTEWGCRDYQITVDGPESEHDRRRVTAGGEGSFRKIWSALTMMQRSTADFRVVVRLGYDCHNMEAILQWVPELAGQFAGDPRFEFYGRPISYPGGSGPQCNAREARLFGIRLMEALSRAGLATVVWSRENRPGGLQCHAGRSNSIMIGPDGALHKCAVGLELPGNHVGELRPDGVLSVETDRWNRWTGSGMPCRVAAEVAGSPRFPKGMNIPSASCPLGPESACPLGPRASCPLGPESACPLGPQASCPLGPESACPLGPQASCPLGPESACPLGPQASCPLGPESACPLGPQASCPLGPVAPAFPMAAAGA